MNPQGISYWCFVFPDSFFLFYGVFLLSAWTSVSKVGLPGCVTFTLLEIEVPNPIDQCVHLGFSHEL